MGVRDLSYRYRIPLALTAVILATEFVVTLTLLSQGLADARHDLRAGATNLVAVLSRSLRDPLLRDDVWQAFEVIRTPIEAREADNALDSITVTDNAARVFVSTDTKTFPMMASVEALSPPAKALLAEPSGKAGVHYTGAGWLFVDDVVASGNVLADDGSNLGRVVVVYDAEKISSRLRKTLLQLFAVTLPGLVVLIAIGWIWGKRIVAPLSRLSYALQRVGKDSPEHIASMVDKAGHAEIALLNARFKDMLTGLAEKERLEKEILTSERLAAVGRVAAGIAHEINNPLGGMLNAVDTLATHGSPDAFTNKTLGLLERGLNQIRTTVGALLVEARLDSPAMSPSDWEDLRTLAAPQIDARRGELFWQVRITEPVPLPSHYVRQLSLNLLLNAVKAIGEHGRIWFRADVQEGSLRIRVANDGEPIPPERMEHLFEPYSMVQHEGGRRSYPIGLWVCYQVTTTLNGSIRAVNDGGVTCFDVTIPIDGAA
ncbi:hypothetical protein D9X30_4629 (plasmid) [Cupriavidus sp. U2]|uniref:sensor histidine kinase n=1 Tax=Cupriavidus sp. U2 TaxID=2920269 RepID=UPI00129D80BE|nr:HAMP domain-containing sensor histidine kinase [Cupriavidus sp. U2]KAI3590396.1 hypothetical protein D9X30_4629 [Cupriavidus sp. U2]